MVGLAGLGDAFGVLVGPAAGAVVTTGAGAGELGAGAGAVLLRMDDATSTPLTVRTEVVGVKPMMLG